MSAPIKMTAEGLEVTLWTDAWPRVCTIRVTEDALDFRLWRTQQIRALHFMLGGVLAADPSPDDRPAK
jgi:hypothetical protein